MNDPQKKYHLGAVSKNILLEGLNRTTAPTSTSKLRYTFRLLMGRKESNQSINNKFCSAS